MNDIDILQIKPALIIFDKKAVSEEANFMIIIENYPISN